MNQTLSTYSCNDHLSQCKSSEGPSGPSLLFDNLPKLIRPKMIAKELGLSVATIYDWKYRAKMRKIPENLFLKIAGRLYIRTDVLSLWIMSGNPS